MQPFQALRMRTPAAAGATDAYWANVVLLAGAEESTAQLVDASKYRRGFTKSGNATVSATQKKFGSRAAYNDSSATGVLSSADASELTIGTGQFTIEAWIYPTGSGNKAIVCQRQNSGNMTSAAFAMTLLGATGKIEFQVQIGGSTVTVTGATTIATSTWTHVAADRDGTGKIRLYVGGVMDASTTNAGSIDNSAHPLTIGATGDGLNQWGGYIDEVRFTNGTARYASDGGLTVPTAAFPRATALSTLDFSSGSLPGGVTLTRTGNGSYLNSSGALALAGTDVARFHHINDGAYSATLSALLVEPAATNLFERSEELDNAYWTKTSIAVTANDIAAPDGNTTADKIQSTSGGGGSDILRNSSKTSGTIYTVSAFIKAGTVNRVKIGQQYAASSYSDNIFDLATGKWVARGAGDVFVENFGGGWFRVSHTVIATGTGSYMSYVGPINNSGTAYTHTTSGNNIYLWGMQFETGNPTSYIATTSGTASRNADSASFTVPSGVSLLCFVFADFWGATASVSPGSYSIPTNMARRAITRIEMF